MAIGVVGLKFEIPTFETKGTQKAAAPLQPIRTDRGHNMMLNKMYELKLCKTHEITMCPQRHAWKHISDSLFKRNTDVRYLEAIWLELAANGLPSLRGSTHRLNNTWTILWKTFNMGLGFHLTHGTWQFKHFEWPANLSIVPCPRTLPYQMAHISAKCHNVETHTQTVTSLTLKTLN